MTPPQDLKGWGVQNKPTGTWTVSQAGELTGTGQNGMTHPHFGLTDFDMKCDAMADADTHGGVVIRRRVRKLPTDLAMPAVR